MRFPQTLKIHLEPRRHLQNRILQPFLVIVTPCPHGRINEGPTDIIQQRLVYSEVIFWHSCVASHWVIVASIITFQDGGWHYLLVCGLREETGRDWGYFLNQYRKLCSACAESQSLGNISWQGNLSTSPYYIFRTWPGQLSINDCWKVLTMY